MKQLMNNNLELMNYSKPQITIHLGFFLNLALLKLFRKINLGV
jgi:hypothetical protein